MKSLPLFFNLLFSRKCGLLMLLQVEKRLKAKLPLSRSLRWKVGIVSETYYWDYFFRTNLINNDEYSYRLDTNTFLPSSIVQLLPSQPTAEILDVGAGPLTSLEKKSPQHIVKITAVDALAKEYSMVLKRHNVNPPVKTQLCKGEELSARFAENSFDLVYARNSIDHCLSPEKAILEMVKVVKKGCHILLEHWANEAENENYEGFHQWNFSEENGDFIIKSKAETINFTKKYESKLKASCSCNESGWLTVVIVKLDIADA